MRLIPATDNQPGGQSLGPIQSGPGSTTSDMLPPLTLHVQGAPSQNTWHHLDVSFILLFLPPNYAHATHLFPLMPPQHSEDEAPTQHSTAGTLRRWIRFRPEGSLCPCGASIPVTQAANTLTLTCNGSVLSARKTGKGDKVSTHQRRASQVSGAKS